MVFVDESLDAVQGLDVRVKVQIPVLHVFKVFDMVWSGSKLRLRRLQAWQQKFMKSRLWNFWGTSRTVISWFMEDLAFTSAGRPFCSQPGNRHVKLPFVVLILFEAVEWFAYSPLRLLDRLWFFTAAQAAKIELVYLHPAIDFHLLWLGHGNNNFARIQIVSGRFDQFIIWCYLNHILLGL